jgi:hypothetical protein
MLSVLINYNSPNLTVSLAIITSSFVGAKVLEGLEFMGIYWDPKKNETIRGEEGFINYPHLHQL